MQKSTRKSRFGSSRRTFHKVRPSQNRTCGFPASGSWGADASEKKCLSPAKLHVPYVELPETIAKLGKALVDGGVLYTSFKYGREEKIRRVEKKKSEQVEGVFGEEESEEKEEREAGGRYFTDLTEEEWKKVRTGRGREVYEGISDRDG